jgi:hypothetical protein
MAMASVKSGVVAFHRPARTEEMCVSPYAISENGNAFEIRARTARCAHVRQPDGSRSRRTSNARSTGAEPSARRASTTCMGESCRSAILMKRKLVPQIALRSRYEPSQEPVGSVSPRSAPGDLEITPT